jgi:hypothetical protein
VKGSAVPKPQWSDFGTIWKTVREVDVNAIRHEAERGIAIVCIGQRDALWRVDGFLRDGPNRYPLDPDPLALVPLAEADHCLDLVHAADLLIVALDAATPLEGAERVGLERLSAAPRPSQAVLLFGEAVGAPTPWSAYLDRSAATLVDPRSPAAAARAYGAILSALPADARLAAARRLPGLRAWFAARLTSEVSISNAAFALASGVPSLVPFLGIPISAADTVILTKNQALMVYRLALACGAPPEFQKRMIEITPVIGGAVVWRQIAGALVGLVPGYGIVPKTAVAFGGTYFVGLAATRWYETGLLTAAERKHILSEASAKARDAAMVMVEQARAAGGKAGAQAQGGLQKVADGAAAARTRAGKVVDGARTATGKATSKAGAQARSASQRLRDGGRKVVRRKPRGVTDGAEEAPDSGAPVEEPA